MKFLLVPFLGFFAALPCQGALSLDFMGREMDATLTLFPGGQNVFGNSSYPGEFGGNGNKWRDFLGETTPGVNSVLFTLNSSQMPGAQFSISLWFEDGAPESFQPGDFTLTIYGLPEAVAGLEYSSVQLFGPVGTGNAADFPFATTATSDGNGNTTLTLTNSGVWEKPALIVKLQGNFTAVPEPSSSLLFGIAAAGFMGLRKRTMKPARAS